MIRPSNQKKKFALMLLAIYVVSLPFISIATYIILRNNAIHDAYNFGRLRLTTMEAVKTYVSEELRPMLYQELPGRFIVEGMSRSYIAGSIARRVQKEYPAYMYKNASLNPINPQNTPDQFEAEIITTFINDETKKEWSGIRTKPDGEYYVIARAGERFTDTCLYCHGEPSVAPKELTAKYGVQSGFHMKAGQLVDAKFVYIPISVPLAAARKIVGIFVGIYTVFFGVIFLIIHAQFTRLFNRIESDKKRIEEINLELMNLNHDMESIISERTMNLIALSVADRVRNPATAIAGTFNRILRKEELSDPLRERLTDLMLEAEKLDAIVRDYETILKSKQVLFRVEEINEVVRGVMPLIETERKAKDLHLRQDLTEKELRCMANKPLLKVAILHVLKNAVEATPQGGTITITTTSDEDNIFLTITDTGKGIPQEEIPKIFSLFYSTKKHRIGMGLPLVKQIVEEHNGTIKIQSTVGKGSSVTIAFPHRWTEQGLEKKRDL